MIHQVVCAAKYMPDEEGLAFARKHLLGYEIPGFVEPEVLENPQQHSEHWKQELSSSQGQLSLHGPVYDLNPVSLDPDIAAASKRRYVQAANVCKALGCRYLVVHSQFSTIFTVAQVQDEWLSASADFWRQFAEEELADSPTLSVVLENFMEEDPVQLRKLIDKVGHPQIKACLDTGHANIFSPAPVNEWLDTLEHQLVYIHSHNNQGKVDEHRGYQNGTVEMEGFLNHLVMLPYKYSLALEIFHQPDLSESYATVQRYLEIQQAQLPDKTFLI